MASEKLILGMAGTVPYYDEKIYLNPSLWQRIKMNLIDYRSLGYNQPIGQGAYFLFKGLQKYRAAGGESVELKMWGNIDERYSALSKAYDIGDMIEIEGFIEKQDSLEKLKRCDVLVLTLSLGVNGNKPFPLPGKMFDYFHVGKPILALVEESYCAEVLRGSGLAYIVDPKDQSAVAKVIEELQKDKENLKNRFKINKEYLEQFEHKQMVKNMAAVLNSL
jgi:glycosyltransferase involved in cell wall biosynthesis